MTRSDVVLVERMAVLAELVKGLAMIGVADKTAGPGGPRKRRRDCGCEHHSGEVSLSSAEMRVRPFVRVFDACSRARVCRKVPPPRRVRWEDACLSTGIAGEGFGRKERSHRSSSGRSESVTARLVGVGA